MKNIILLLCAMLAIAGSAFSQRNCGAMQHLHNMELQDPTVIQTREAIEQFTQNFVANGGGQTNGRALITIPVVVHVVYKTTAQNISDAQIQSQIDILNKDFRKLNTDWTGTPSAFQSLVADCEFQFCLAQRTPTGGATNGIVRKATTVTSFSTNDAVKKSAQGGDDAWDRNSYLNLWVCNLGTSLLGYAQFPGGTAATDGVVINYTAFGNTGTATAPFAKGRTATHEVGHWFNLYHIWGDDGTGCTGTDNVSDTPNQADENYGCPAFPTVSCSNGPNGDMFMNYMDYTDDACMFMFTPGQKARMQALFATGGARVSLLSSLGCQAPATSCGTPSGLTSSSVAQTTATVSWAAVSGATSYNLQYKTSASSTWTTLANSTTSRALSGLAAGTTYNYQVQAVCASGSSAYSTASSFTTLTSGTTCGTVGGLASSSITQTTATVSWSAVSGATSYNLQYKTSASSTWTTVANSTTSRALSGLTAATTYNYQVQVVCASGSGAYSTASSFTTLSATGTCANNYESNGTLSTATSIAVNTNIYSMIGTSTDNDYFKFSNTSTQKNIYLTLTTLPKDYDLKLYNASGTLLGTSQNGNTTGEGLIYNNAPVGTYYARVYGYNGVYSTTSCYTLNASISSAAFRMEEQTDNSGKEAPALSCNLYPNPSTGNVHVDMNVERLTEKLSICVYDMLGNLVRSRVYNAVEGNFSADMDLNDMANGIYNVVINTDEVRETKKLIISK